ncbi:stage II sporulation protein R [Lactonifactor longoviformis]|uniref:Stage II sporulation protein R n=1 Tax=Lactonifactor longoviformis DSM 17459 TaxID=1122155 RepID=A0A1M5BTV4_9CLOT|nr:stage II sporulation protein R [Lactonifactor longoviformis]POP33688.1 stage II sporulation protein R [Lactonifactor longoviformis]SHF45846.1 stage II sporulation protein R [Lactonifactor longoviformis DSM 17459]
MKITANRKKYIIAAALSLGVLGGILAASFTARAQGETSRKIQQGIAKEIIRFHVLANSDSEEDQGLKIKVKNRVVEYLHELLGDDTTLEETRKAIVSHMEEIRDISREVIEKEGYAYPVTAGLTTAYFPEKTYGDCTFPPGEYEALQIKIGEAEGHNWWCVLYPSLCFVDDTHGVVTEEKKEELKNVLTEEEYDTVTDTPRVKITFKWLPH